MVIDPITQKHANISVKTPSQLVRLQQIQLPTQLRPFPLVRQNAQSIRSIGQFIGRQELMSRAECTVDGNRVNTFGENLKKFDKYSNFAIYRQPGIQLATLHQMLLSFGKGLRLRSIRFCCVDESPSARQKRPKG